MRPCVDTQKKQKKVTEILNTELNNIRLRVICGMALPSSQEAIGIYKALCVISKPM